MMRGNVFWTQALGELVRHALGQPPRVDGNERGAMLFDELHQALVNLGPYLVRHHRLEGRLGHLDGDIHLAPMPLVDDRALPTGQEARDLLDRLLRRREPDALERPAADVVEALERKREMRAATR